MISLKNVTKEYVIGGEQIKALNDVSFTIEKGDFIGIIGASGSGKSTLMNIIGGLDRPSSGKVFVHNNDILNFNDKKLSDYRNRKIGFVFQSFHLLSELSALENVALPLMYAGKDVKMRTMMARKALNLVGLSDRVNHTPMELSGGQRQRVAIARAIVNSPDMILADEPTGNLDSASGKLVLDILKTLNLEGYTILMVTHNTMQASYFNRMITIVDGKVV